MIEETFSIKWPESRVCDDEAGFGVKHSRLGDFSIRVESSAH